METIFEHNPTKAELLELTGGMTIAEYLSHWMFSKKHSLLDIVLLYELRNNETLASRYRSLIPELYQEYQLGIDNANLVI